LKLAPAHESVVPFPQSIVTGVVILTLFPLQVRFTLNPLLVVTGAVHVILVQFAGVRGRIFDAHACPVIIAPNASVYW